MKLLQIESSVLGEASASRQLSAAIVQAWARAMPGLEIVRRDLDADPIPHLDSRLLAAARPDLAALAAREPLGAGFEALKRLFPDLYRAAPALVASAQSSK
jgi:FMN-dependent NADH-azoreductase